MDLHSGKRSPDFQLYIYFTAGIGGVQMWVFYRIRAKILIFDYKIKFSEEVRLLTIISNLGNFCIAELEIRLFFFFYSKVSMETCNLKHCLFQVFCISNSARTGLPAFHVLITSKILSNPLPFFPPSLTAALPGDETPDH